jgi:hypothetical protein
LHRLLTDQEVADLLERVGVMLLDQHGTPLRAETASGDTALATARKVMLIAAAVIKTP